MKKQGVTVIPYLTPEHEGSENMVLVGGRLTFGPTDHRRIKRTVRKWALINLGQKLKSEELRAFSKCVS